MAAVQLFENDGVLGSVLDDDSLSNCNIIQLKRWLECRALSQPGKKGELMTRTKNHISAGQAHILDPSTDHGVWLDLKSKGLLNREMLIPRLRKPCLPIVGWRDFPGYDIPSLFNEGHVYCYAVESLPLISVQGKEITINAAADDDSVAQAQNAKPGSVKVFRRAQRSVKSGFVHEVHDNLQGNIYFVRCSVRASMKQLVYKVLFGISTASGCVLYGECNKMPPKCTRPMQPCHCSTNVCV